VGAGVVSVDVVVLVFLDFLTFFDFFFALVESVAATVEPVVTVDCDDDDEVVVESAAKAATANEAAIKAARTILIEAFMKHSFKRLNGW
jgi:hypothetical protein